MAGSGAIIIESGVSSSTLPSGLPPIGESHFREAFARIDGMRKAGALLCDVAVVFGNGNQIKVLVAVVATVMRIVRLSCCAVLLWFLCREDFVALLLSVLGCSDFCVFWFLRCRGCFILLIGFVLLFPCCCFVLFLG